MIERLIAASVHNRTLVILLAGALAAAGLVAWRNTPVDAIPDLSDVQVVVYTPVPGQAPQVVEDQVTYPLTTALLSVPSARTVRGYSYFGYSLAFVLFDDGTDLYDARARVLESLEVATDRLPDGVSPRLGPDATGVGWVYMYTLSEFGPRARRLRAAMDMDGDGVVARDELPPPDEAIVALPTGGCRVPRILEWCGFPEIQPLSEPRPVYSEGVLRDLLRDPTPPSPRGTEAWTDEGVRFLVDGFDRDADGRIGPDELLRAANFEGLDLAQLRTIQDFTLRYDLTALPGVAEVATVGGFQKEYQVEVDPERLRAYGVTLAQVESAIRRSNMEVGGRLVEMAETEFMVRGRGYITRVEDLLAVPVGMDEAGHTPILLAQVARVHVGPSSRRGLAELDGMGEVVSGIIVMRHGENPREVIDRVRTRLDELRRALPEGVEIHTSYDRSELIDAAVANLEGKLVDELLVVAVLCVVFLLHLRSALVAVITVPLGVLAAFLGMQLMGLQANLMSLGGIAIAIGVMVDAAVVLVENLHKHRERYPDKPPDQQAIGAAIEVGPALFFSLLVVTVSFLPVLTLGGEAGRLFSPLAWTKTLAMAAAAFLAVTVAPALATWLVRGRIRSERSHPLSRVTQAIYRPLLRLSLTRWGGIVLVAGAVAFVAATQLPKASLGTEFMPDVEEGDLLYMPTTPPGISITKARELLQQTDKLIASHPQVAHVLGKVGRAETATDPAPLSMIETTIRLTPRETWPAGKTLDDVIAELDARVRIPGLTNAWTMPIRARLDMLATGIRTPVGIKLLGDDLDELARVGAEIEAVLAEVPGTGSAYAERVTGGNYVEVAVKRDQAARFGLTVGDVQAVVQSAIGGRVVTQTVEGIERYPVLVRFPRELRDDLASLSRVAVPTPMGHMVPLAQVAELSITKGPPMIKSENARRTAWIHITPTTDDVSGYVERARAAVDQRVVLPPGVALAWAGEIEWIEQTRDRERLARLAALGLIVLLLYIHFKSLARTALVLAVLPVATAGGWWCLWAMGYETSVATQVGFIALFGLAAETAVVMLTYLDEAVARHRAEHRLTDLAALGAAIEEGAVDRLRPKLMTVATTFLALVPVLLGDEPGTTVMRRIALPMLGGLFTSTVATLLVIPAAYALLARWSFRPQRPDDPYEPYRPRPEVSTPGVAAVRVREP